MLHNIIKTFTEDNLEKSVTYQIVHSYYNSLSFLDKIYFHTKNNFYFSTTSSTREVFLKHRNEFKESLNLIKNNDFDLKDVSMSTHQLFKPNLTTFLNTYDTKSRYHYLLEAVPTLNDYQTYWQEPHTYEYLSNKEVGWVKEMFDLPRFSRIVDKLPSDKADINALLVYTKNYTPQVSTIFNNSKKHIKDITSSPEYNDFIECVSNMFDPLTFQETLEFFQFAQIQPKLSFLLIHPCLVSVLGNAMFLKFFIPLISSSTLKGPLYNWAKVREDIQKKVYHKKRFKYINSLLEQSSNLYTNNRSTINTIASVASSVYPTIRILQTIRSVLYPPITSSEERITYREIVDLVPRGSGLEQYGVNLDPLRRLISAVGTEIARTVGSVTDGIIRGSMDRARPSAERVADAIDRRNQ